MIEFSFIKKCEVIFDIMSKLPAGYNVVFRHSHLRTEQDIHKRIFASNRQLKTPRPKFFDGCPVYR